MPHKPPKHRPPRAAGISDPRPSAARRGYDHKWRAFREQYLLLHPVCVECRRTQAEHVDHVVSLRCGGAKYDEANLRALCASCHAKKTAKHDGSFGRKGK